MKLLCYGLLLLALFNTAKAQTQLKGQVLNEQNQNPIPNVTIHIAAINQSVVTDAKGKFSLILKNGVYQLTFKHIAYQSRSQSVTLPSKDTLFIRLSSLTNQLAEVTVNTGYQSLTKQSATGAFVVVEKALLNRTVSTNIIDRLQNIVPGLSFNKVGVSSDRLNLSIRGQSTINANADPLVILDNFPYEGDINSINPEDIESVSILKDAAATSIWGARAANGVIVLTSKIGKYNQKPQIGFNSSVNLIERPDAFYKRRIGTAAYIDIQTKLFKQGYYNTLEQNDIRNISHSALPPLVEILIAQRDNLISQEEANSQIALLKQKDVRKDVNTYLNGTGINQQYALNLSGGSTNHSYYAAGGYDHNKANQIGNDLKRISIQTSQNWSFLANKLQLTSNLAYTRILTQNNALAYTYTDPYVLLADEFGNPLAVPTLRSNFLASSAQKGLHNWDYMPLLEKNELDKTVKNEDIRFNIGLAYKVMPSLTANIRYQYGQTNSSGTNYASENSYYSRNLINTYTQVNTDGSLTLPIPIGGIMNLNNYQSANHNLRTQLAYNKEFNTKHQLDAIAGYEIKKLDAISRGYRLYGYDDEHASSAIVDYATIFPSYQTPASRTKIRNEDSNAEMADRFLSYYSNLSYAYLQKYMFSASARLDQSNLFGVKTNQKGVPLFSAGMSWIISKEDFFRLKFVDNLKLRLTYGYNGNIDRRLSAYTTAIYFASNVNAQNTLIKQPGAQIQNPPNPDLKWERVRMMNIGTDFALLKNRVSGSIDVYSKAGIDLIGDTPFPPSTGIANFRGNYANTKGNGVDVAIQTINIDQKLKWTSNFVFAYVRDKVTTYNTKASALTYLTGSGYPLNNKPIYAVYSYEWAGLEPSTGNPQGLLNGTPSTDYAKIIAAYTPEKLIYHGSARPTHFGAIRNNFNYGNLSLSFNISYKLNYYFKRGSITYGPTFGLESAHADYLSRWQQPGDEKFTNVPSVPITNNTNRDNFYAASSTLIERGDHVRFEDINLSYAFSPAQLKAIHVKQLQLFIYATNIGLLYKKTNAPVIPDYESSNYGPSRTLSIGLRTTL